MALIVDLPGYRASLPNLSSFDNSSSFRTLLGTSLNLQVASDGISRSVDPDGLIATTPAFDSPVINKNYTADQFVANGSTFTFTPSLDNSPTYYNWSLGCAPDECTINPKTGQITIDTSTMPTQSGVIPNQSRMIEIRCQNARDSTGDGYYDSITVRLHIGKTIGQIKYVGTSETYTTIKAAALASTSGDTIVVRDGVYQGDDNMMSTPSGAQPQVTTGGTINTRSCIMAESPCGVTIDGQEARGACVIVGNYYAGVNIDRFNSGSSDFSVDYLDVDGFHYKSSNISNGVYFANRITLRNCIFGDAINYSNTHNVVNAQSSNCNQAVFEGCFAYGYGRYKFQHFESINSVARRCFARYDAYFGIEPAQSIGTLYLALNCYLQNVWAFDSESTEFYASIEESFATITSSHQLPGTGNDSYLSGNKIQRCGTIRVFNSGYDARARDADQSAATNVEDFVSINTTLANVIVNPYFPIATQGPSNIFGSTWFNLDLNNNIVYDNSPLISAPFWTIGTRLLMNNAAISMKNYNPNLPLMQSDNGDSTPDVIIRNYSVYNSETNQEFEYDIYFLQNGGIEEDRKQIQPNAANGLVYPIRLEDNSPMKLELVGAQNTEFHIGKQGTAYGDPDNETATSIPILPIPLEKKWREINRDYTWVGPSVTSGLSGSDILSGNRGPAVIGDSLTRYFLTDMGGKEFPINFSAVEDGASTVWASWDIPCPLTYADITGFKVMGRNVTDNGAFEDYGAAIKHQNSKTISGLITGKTYEFYVVAGYADGLFSERSYISTVVMS